MPSLRIQLWSYNYDPEPTGIGPVSATWAREMRGRGHEVTVMAAHPHYPEPRWDRRLRPYRERRDGVPVYRLPLWIGRESGPARLRQEASYALALGAVAPLLPRPDVVVAVSPCFPALAPAMGFARAHRVPWVLWLQDIVTAGAETTGLLSSTHPALRAAKWLERTAYASASGIVVISDAFAGKLREAGVAQEKIDRIYNPVTQHRSAPGSRPASPPRVLTMGNVGHSQGLDAVVRAFEASSELRSREARLVILGAGVAEDDVRSAIATDRVEMPGLVSEARLREELDRATLGLVSQRADVAEFNLPSKLMNFMGRALPVVAHVNPGSEAASLVQRAEAGWVSPAGDDQQFAATLARAIDDEAGRRRRGAAGRSFADENFAPSATAARFEQLLLSVTERS